MILANQSAVSDLQQRPVMPGEFFDQDAYQRMINNNAPNSAQVLEDTYLTYVSCQTGRQAHLTGVGFFLDTDGQQQARTANPSVNDNLTNPHQVTVEQRIQNCLALQAFMNTPADDQGAHHWTSVTDDQVTALNARALAVARSNADFSWGGHIDTDTASRFSHLAQAEIATAMSNLPPERMNQIAALGPAALEMAPGLSGLTTSRPFVAGSYAENRRTDGVRGINSAYWQGELSRGIQPFHVNPSIPAH